MVIYKLTSPSGKMYIGKAKDFNLRMNQHRRYAEQGKLFPLYKAIRYYGWDVFQKEIIDTAETIEELNEKEKYWIAKYNTYLTEFGYNCTPGGDGGAVRLGKKNSLEHRQRISEGLKGRKYSEETRQKMSTSHKGQPSAWKGQKASKELRQHLSDAHKGHKHSPETIQKMIKSRTGSKRSEETKQRMAEAKRLWWEKKHEEMRAQGKADNTNG